MQTSGIALGIAGAAIAIAIAAIAYTSMVGSNNNNITHVTAIQSEVDLRWCKQLEG